MDNMVQSDRMDEGFVRKCNATLGLLSVTVTMLK